MILKMSDKELLAYTKTLNKYIETFDKDAVNKIFTTLFRKTML
jgi:hypothetical protein